MTYPEGQALEDGFSKGQLDGVCLSGKVAFGFRTAVFKKKRKGWWHKKFYLTNL